MSFFTRSARPPRQLNSSGSRIRPKYRRQLLEDQLIHLVEDGNEDFYAGIQAHAAEVGVYQILNRYAESGDPSLLERQKGAYIDATKSPRSLAEVEQFRIDSERAFYGLPLDIRKLFNNNPRVFMSNPAYADEVLSALEGTLTGVAGKAAAKTGSETPGAATGTASEAGGTGEGGVV